MKNRVCCLGSCSPTGQLYICPPAVEKTVRLGSPLCGTLLGLGFVWQPVRFEKLTQGLQYYAL